MYRFPYAVDTVSKALAVIGTAQIRKLALSMSVARSFAGLPNDRVSMENFWRHSLWCALAARHLAKAARQCGPDALFTGGLLHDIGELIIFNRLPEQAKEALLIALDGADDVPVHEAERQAMGFDHSSVGGELARQWQLPPLLEDSIAHHHDVANAQQYPRGTARVHLANICALMAEIDSLDPADGGLLPGHRAGTGEALAFPAQQHHRRAGKGYINSIRQKPVSGDVELFRSGREFPKPNRDQRQGLLAVTRIRVRAGQTPYLPYARGGNDT